MKLGLVQSYIQWEDKQANQEKAQKKMEEATRLGVDLLLFPEMSFTGFSMEVERIGEEDGETIEFLRKCAQQYRMNIGAGWVERTGKKGKNHYTIVGRNGDILLDYVKMHPFSYSGEDKYYEAGDGYEVVEVDGIPLTTFICYDLRFPMSFWKASEKAHLILLPANWPQRRIGQFKTLLQARAIENQVYFAAINCVGDIHDISYSGATCFINPKGEVVAMVEDEETMLVVDMEDDVELQRKRFPVHQDRRREER